MKRTARQMMAVIERLEARMMWSAAPAHASEAPAAANATTRFAVSDIFGAAAGVAIWQGGQPVLPGNAGSTDSGSFPSPSEGSQVSGTENGALLAGTTAPGSPSIFSLLPVLPPDGLAAEVVGLIDPSQGVTATNFNNAAGAIGNATSRAYS